MVGFQQSTQSLEAEDLTLAAFMLRLDDPVETLVNPLVVIVLEVLTQDVAQLFFGGEDEMIETFLVEAVRQARHHCQPQVSFHRPERLTD